MSTASDSSALTPEGTAAYRQQVEEAASTLRNECPSSPTVGLLNDTEVGGLLDEGTVEGMVPYADLPHFPASDGALTIGTLEGVRVVVLDQRLHLYDGDTPREVTFPVRMLAAAGIEALLLPATAGSVNPQFERGDLMVLTDHVNFQGRNPLVGPNVEAWGPRFPDMTDPYDARLQQEAGAVAREEGMSLQKGVYLALLGPTLETTAEHRMARRLGADAVGMSVVPEVIVARHMNVRVMAVALLTEQHLRGGRPTTTPTEADEETVLARARSRLQRLLRDVVAKVGTEEIPT